MTKKIIAYVSLLSLLIVPFAASKVQAATTWDTTGNYVVAFNFEGNDYEHDLTLVQDSTGTITSGNGGYPAGGPHTYTWAVNSGTVTGNNINLATSYTLGATCDMTIEGTIGLDGSMSGTWTDNCGGVRAGTWQTTAGEAKTGSLAPEDFGVVSYDTSLGMLKGYSAGFGLSDATLGDTATVVVKLYAGDQLLQTNTAMMPAFSDLPGSQFSSPFDVSGNFDYATDGYWTNVRETQYGQSVPATKVVATVTLENGQVLTATNTTIAGDPTTIYPPVVPPPVTPDSKDACKNGGWKTFSSPSYKNQGQCVSSMAKTQK